MSSDAESSPPIGLDEALDRLGAWVRREPVAVALFALAAGVLIYFYGFYKVFVNGSQSTALWAWLGWNEENDQQHCVAIMPAVAFLLWYHSGEMIAAVKRPSGRGLAFVIGGVIMFLLAVRCLQPRFAIVSLPLIIYGAAEYLGGKAVARSFIFPCLLMLFMIPIGGVIQATVSLQLLASKAVGVICSFLGIHVQIEGTNINVEGHSFEVAGGCSGIRSLMAMSMLAALYVHFILKETWKQVVTFSGSIVFALVGNIARLLAVVLVAKWYDPEFAGGRFHDYSGFVFFPFAVVAMVAFANLINRDWLGMGSKVAKTLATPDRPPEKSDPQAGHEKPASPISYDY